MADEPLLDIENVSLRFGDKWALRNVSLKLYPGETRIIFGEAGSGRIFAGQSRRWRRPSGISARGCGCGATTGEHEDGARLQHARGCSQSNGAPRNDCGLERRRSFDAVRCHARCFVGSGTSGGVIGNSCTECAGDFALSRRWIWKQGSGVVPRNLDGFSGEAIKSCGEIGGGPAADVRHVGLSIGNASDDCSGCGE